MELHYVGISAAFDPYAQARPVGRCAECGAALYDLSLIHIYEQQHHTAASADEAADKADEHAAQHGLHGFCAGAFVRVGPFGCHHGTHDEFNAQQQRHHNRETAHGAVGHQRGRPASHHCDCLLYTSRCV